MTHVALRALLVLTLAQPAVPATRESQTLPSLAPLVDSVKAAVVNVDVQSRPNRNADSGGEEFFDPFGFGGGRNRRRRDPQVMQEKGSGFIIDPKGLVLTNNHVVEGAISIRIHLDDGRTFDCDVLGRDPLTDVALAKIRGKAEGLPFVHLGDSDALRVGDWVLAIGNPFGLASSVSAGIISARARNLRKNTYDDFLQTDAAINPGNSGGPLFNMRGEVIGINTAIIGSGIGFAVPINLAKALLPQLESRGSVTRGFLGIGIQDLTPDLGRALGLPVTEGAIVGQVAPGTPAAKAQVHEDDVVVALDGEKVLSGAGLSRSVALKHPGTTITLTLYRTGKKQEVKVELGTRPDLEGVGPAAPSVSDAPAPSEQLGLLFNDMDPRLANSAGLPLQGAIITEVTPGSPAERAGLEHGMIVVEAGGKPVKSAADLARTIKAAKSGATVLLRIQSPRERALRALPIP